MRRWDQYVGNGICNSVSDISHMLMWLSIWKICWWTADLATLFCQMKNSTVTVGKTNEQLQRSWWQIWNRASKNSLGQFSQRLFVWTALTWDDCFTPGCFWDHVLLGIHVFPLFRLSSADASVCNKSRKPIPQHFFQWKNDPVLLQNTVFDFHQGAYSLPGSTPELPSELQHWDEGVTVFACYF